MEVLWARAEARVGTKKRGESDNHETNENILIRKLDFKRLKLVGEKGHWRNTGKIEMREDKITTRLRITN